MIYVIIFSVLVVLVSLIWWLPRLQMNMYEIDNLSQSEHIDLENKLRLTVSQVLGGALILSGVYFSYNQNVNLKLKQDNEILSNGLKQLNDTLPTIRLGAIYSLYKLATNSESDKGIIIDIFVKYIYDVGSNPGNRAEVQLILNTLGAKGFLVKSVSFRKIKFKLITTSDADFRSIHFPECEFDSCGFYRDDFSFQSFDNKFVKCDLYGCDFERANLSNANFQSCEFTGGDFSYTFFADAHFADCSFSFVDFRKSNVAVANDMPHYNGKPKFEKCSIYNREQSHFDTSKVIFINSTIKIW